MFFDLSKIGEWLGKKLSPNVEELTDEELGIETPDEGYIPFDGIAQPKAMASTEPTLFDVYDMRGMQMKSKATFQNLRDGLRPGLYIVNGKKMLIK